MTYHEERAKRKLGLLPKMEFKKQPKPLKKKSDKRLAEEAAAKVELGEDETLKEKWFKNRRKEMIGTCQCGCGMPSSKKDDANFISSICHIFPQRLFPSVQYHRLNWVERKFWATNGTSACHSQMDNKSMDLWVNFADWDDIQEKVHQLIPLLSETERKTKFFRHLEELIYQ